MDTFKKRKQFRKKPVGEDEEQPQIQDITTDKPTDTSSAAAGSNKAPVKPKKTDAKPTVKLSFDEEEGEDQVFEVKKNKGTTKKKSTRKYMRDNTAATPAPLTNVAQSSYGDYTPEMLEQLKKNSISLLNRAAPAIDASQHRIVAEEQDEDEPQVADIGSSDATVLNAAQLEQMELQQEEEDEELKRWEMQQIRKGATAAGAGQQSVPTHAQLKQAVAKPTTAATAAQRETLAQAILGTTAKVTVDEVQKKLKAALAVVTDKHSVHSKQFNHSRTTVENARKAVDELDVQYAKRSENFLFYSELRDYILDLCDCLASKSAEVDECEGQLMNLEIAHAQAQEKLKFKPGELWKDADQTPAATVNGTNTDQQQQATEDDYAEKKNDLLYRGEQIFADTFEEFSSTEVIKRRFEEWKFNHTDTYDKTYCANIMPSLFAPFAKVELLKWNPLLPLPSADVTTFDTMNWYTTLFNYGLSDSAPANEKDEDLNLIPNLIAKVVVPKSVKLLSHVWDIRDVQQTTRATELVRQLAIYLDPHSDSMKEIIAAIAVNIQGGIEAIPHTVHSKDNPTTHLENAVKLVSNILQWQEHLSVDTLQKLIAENLLNSKVIPICNQAKSLAQVADVMERITSKLPRSWFEKESSGKVPTRFALLDNFLVNFVKKVETAIDKTVVDSNKQAVYAKLAAALRNLNDKDTSQRVASKS